jgi:hypothetical protein
LIREHFFDGRPMIRKAARIGLAIIAGFAVYAIPVSACACSHHGEKHPEPVASCHGHQKPDAGDHHADLNGLEPSHSRDDKCVSEACVCVPALAKLLFKSESLKLKKHSASVLPSTVKIEGYVALHQVSAAVSAVRSVPLHPPPRGPLTRGPPVS